MATINSNQTPSSATSYRQLLAQLDVLTAEQPKPPALARDSYVPSVQPVAAGGLAEAQGLFKDLLSRFRALMDKLFAKQPDPAPQPAPAPTPAPAPVPAPAPAPAAPTYTVGKGDSLWAIAKRHLGDGNRWPEIFELNKDQISDPNLIHPGQVLKLPGGSSAPAQPAPQPTPPPAPAPAPKPPAPSGGTYTVSSGDTLSGIAQRTLGNGNRWPEIYELNRDQISNPDVIREGQVLKLPGGAHSAAPAPAPAPSSSGGWARPVSGSITSKYGMRIHPITGKNKLHSGLDIGAASGTPIKVPTGGRVSFAGWNGGYGNYVVVDHGNGLTSAYAHMSAINVSVGQQIGAGHVVGKVGSTGDSTGPHLHFEVKRNGQFIDPLTMLA